MRGPERARRPCRRNWVKVARSRTRQMTDVVRRRAGNGPGGEVVKRTQGSRRQRATTLAPAGLDDAPSRARRHAMAKAVVLGPLSSVGLKGPLHRSSSSLAAQPGSSGRVQASLTPRRQTETMGRLQGSSRRSPTGGQNTSPLAQPGGADATVNPVVPPAGFLQRTGPTPRRSCPVGGGGAGLRDRTPRCPQAVDLLVDG